MEEQQAQMKREGNWGAPSPSSLSPFDQRQHLTLVEFHFLLYKIQLDIFLSCFTVLLYKVKVHLPSGDGGSSPHPLQNSNLF